MALASAAAGIGTAISAGGQIAGGVMANKQAQEEARDIDLQVAEQRKRTQTRLTRQEREEKRYLGDQTTSIAAAGVDVSGSMLANLQDTAESFREERQDIKQTADFEIRQLLTGARRTRRAGRQALASGIVSGVSSGLGGAARIKGMRD